MTTPLEILDMAIAALRASEYDRATLLLGQLRTLVDPAREPDRRDDEPAPLDSGEFTDLPASR